MFGTYDLKAIFGLRGKKKVDLWGDEWESDPLREEMFNAIASEDEKFLKAQKRNITEKFHDFLKYRVERPSNLIIMIEGPQGEGKSKVGEWLVLEWKYAMKEYAEKIIHTHFTFNIAQSQNLLSKMQNGDIILQDEDARLVGRGAATAQAELQNLVETMRYTQDSIIICAPHIKMLPGMVTLLKPMGQFPTEEKSKFKSRVLVYQLNEDRPGTSSRYVCLGYIEVDVGSIPDEFEQQYQIAKDKNFQEIKKNLGGVGAQNKAQLKTLKQFAKKIYKIAIKHGWPRDTRMPSKKALNLYIKEAEIACSNDDWEDIKTLVVDLYWEKQEKQQKTRISLPKTEEVSMKPIFTIDIKDILHEIETENASETNISRKMEIYRASLDPLRTGEEFIKKYNISNTQIRKDKNRIQGMVNYKQGKLFEHFLRPHAEAIYEEVIIDGRSGEFDLLCKKKGKCVLYSVKCLNMSRPSFDLSYMESKAEIESARQMDPKPDLVVCLIFNIFSQKIYEHIFEKDIIQMFVPYHNRNIKLHLDEFTRDPVKGDPWMVCLV